MLSINKPYTSHSIILGLVGHNKKVLEIGCATGYMSKYLKENNSCKVTGVEINKDFVKNAKDVCDRLIIGDIENKDTLNKINDIFDVIICADVLEHLFNPYFVLINLKNFLTKDGNIIVSIPNVACWEIRKRLLVGNFDYEDSGILDKTHIRFFTLKTAREMFEKCNLQIECFHATLNRLPYPLKQIQRYIGKFFIQYFPTLFGYQFVFKLIEKKGA